MSRVNSPARHSPNQSLFLFGDPTIAQFYVRALDRRPGDTVRRFLLARFASVLGKSMIKRLAINVLRVRRQVALHRLRQIVIGSVRHGNSPAMAPKLSTEEFG